MIEPLLDPANARASLFPIIYDDIWQAFKTHDSAFWFAEEVDLREDITHWNTKLNDDERFYIKHVLAFFAGSDFLVNRNENKKKDEIQIMEYGFYLVDKIKRENVHTESYGIQVEAFVHDPEEKKKLLNAIETIPSIKKKADWFNKYIDNGTFVQRQVSGAITEGIFFSGSFAAIFWLKKRQLMPGLCQYNEMISRDEGIHRDIECMIYKKYIVNKLPVEEVVNMIKEAVTIEIEFCTESLPVNLIGMNKDLMAQYIKYVADHLAMELLGITIYNVENPFVWMTLMSMQVKADFFSKRVNNYAKQVNLTSKEDNTIRIVDDY